MNKNSYSRPLNMIFIHMYYVAQPVKLHMEG